MGNRWNSLLGTRFRGCEQVGYVNRDDKMVHLRVYKLPDEENLVGVYDGQDCWVCSPAHSLFGMKRGISPEHPEICTAATRKRVVVADIPTRKQVTVESKPRKRILICQG
jgi:hypothetical protein